MLAGACSLQRKGERGGGWVLSDIRSQCKPDRDKTITSAWIWKIISGPWKICHMVQINGPVHWQTLVGLSYTVRHNKRPFSVYWSLFIIEGIRDALWILTAVNCRKRTVLSTSTLERSLFPVVEFCYETRNSGDETRCRASGIMEDTCLRRGQGADDLGGCWISPQ